MKEAGIALEVRTKNTDEVYPSELKVEDIPVYLAQLKAAAFKGELKATDLLITADTIVSLHGQMIGKPHDRADAIRILSGLSGNKHTVITGLCLTTACEQKSIPVFTDVYFRNLDKEIDRKRTEQSFFVPKEEIAENGYDLSINKYKEIEYVPVEYPSTQEIMTELHEIEMKIGEEMQALEELLGLK